MSDERKPGIPRVRILREHMKGAFGAASRIESLLQKAMRDGVKPKEAAKGVKALHKDFKKKQIPRAFLMVLNDTQDSKFKTFLESIQEYLNEDKDWIKWSESSSSSSSNIVDISNKPTDEEDQEPAKVRLIRKDDEDKEAEKPKRPFKEVFAEEVEFRPGIWEAQLKTDMYMVGWHIRRFFGL